MSLTSSSYISTADKSYDHLIFVYMLLSRECSNYRVLCMSAFRVNGKINHEINNFNCDY